MIDINKIEDDVLYTSKEICEFINIKTLRTFLELKKKYDIKPSGKNGKNYLYSGREIKKFLEKRLSE